MYIFIYLYKHEILISNYHDVIYKIDDRRKKNLTEKIITINE